MANGNSFLIDHKEELKKEEFRFGTFVASTWPSSCPISSSEFAKMGFYYTGNDDEVQCVFCAVRLKGWKTGDKILNIHLKKSPKCKFLKGKDVGNVAWPKPASFVQPVVVNTEPSTSEDKTVSSFYAPNSQYPGYASERSRIGTLRGWPKAKSHNIQVMAASGLFRTGDADKMKCFYCGGGFENWYPGDDPVKIHKQFFPHCSYIQQYVMDQARQAITGAKDKERELGNHPEILKKTVNEQAEELDTLKQEITCDICMSGKVDTILLPCGHVFCLDCCQKLQRCAKCRTLILEIKQFYK